MGFDNESILNIQSLPGEYFCPICRQLVYPNEALQTQCTHLYCKPCLTYCVSTTLACACCCMWINMAGLSSKTIPTPCKSYPCCSPPWLAAWFALHTNHYISTYTAKYRPPPLHYSSYFLKYKCNYFRVESHEL